MAEEDKWIQVSVFDNSFQAHILKGKLESESIACKLIEDSMSRLLPGSIGRFILMVPEDKFKDAVKVMNRTDEAVK